MQFTRITVNPHQIGGLPCVRGLRMPVSVIIAMLGNGMTEEEILSDHPDLEKEDIKEALLYASEAVRKYELPLITP